VGISLYIVPGFDVVRFGWSEPFPGWIQVAALVAHTPCFLFLGWVMLTNTYLSQVVEIDHEREHHVITGRPYSIIRRPMYSVVIVLYMAYPVALGSRFGLIPALLFTLLRNCQVIQNTPSKLNIDYSREFGKPFNITDNTTWNSQSTTAFQA
jgi:protein-S-isoprenylcysteine O-methyltransferase Ste14